MDLVEMINMLKEDQVVFMWEDAHQEGDDEVGRCKIRDETLCEELHEDLAKEGRRVETETLKKHGVNKKRPIH